MQILVQAQHNVEYETSFDEDDTKWDIEEAIDKFNDNCIPDNIDRFLSSYFNELNLELRTIKLLSVNDCYMNMGNQSGVYRYMQDEPIFKVEFKIQVVNDETVDEDEIKFVASELIDTIFENLNSNMVYVSESGVNVKPNFGLDDYYETAEDFEDDEGEVSFYLDHRDSVEIKMIKEVK